MWSQFSISEQRYRGQFLLFEGERHIWLWKDGSVVHGADCKQNRTSVCELKGSIRCSSWEKRLLLKGSCYSWICLAFANDDISDGNIQLLVHSKIDTVKVYCPCVNCAVWINTAVLFIGTQQSNQLLTVAERGPFQLTSIDPKGAVGWKEQ